MIHHGDCLEVMATFEPESIDAIVTDPPYGLGFMGKAWDHGTPGVPFWTAMLRVAKPGAHLIAFGGTRTVHRIAVAIEDAGWEIRDTLVWAYASGFPKSLDVSKAIDKAAGAERQKLPTGDPVKRMIPGADQNRTGDWTKNNGREYQPGTELPATPDAETWQGWGTALKPAWEPIVLARKPLRGTVAGNVLAYGTGALNIDATRIGTGDGGTRDGEATATTRYGARGIGFQPTPGPRGGDALGRWPSNLILTDPIFDGDTPGVVGGGDAGVSAGGVNNRGMRGDGWNRPSHVDWEPSASAGGFGDSGTYSRFFLIPKAARSDREPVLGGLAVQDDDRDGSFGLDQARPHTKPDYQYERKARANVHPTVKPTELMRHLVRLVTPPGGLVLDPFLGSGTTALAAEMEGFRWVGIEREAEYVAIAEARLNGTQRGLGLVG